MSSTKTLKRKGKGGGIIGERKFQTSHFRGGREKRTTQDTFYTAKGKTPNKRKTARR